MDKKLTKHILINADDFGWTHGHNQAVEIAHTRGILNRASLMCNTPGFDEAVQIVRRCPELSVGVHLTLNESAPLLAPDALPTLTAQDGRFHDGPYALAELWGRGRLLRDEALPEWRAQLEKALSAGIPVGHLDSHKHVHLFPPLLSVIVDLACQYEIPYVRLPLEQFSAKALRRGPAWLALFLLAYRARPRLLDAGLKCADTFVGVASSGRMTPPLLRRAIAEARGVTEIMVHPAVITPEVQELR